MNEDVYYCEHLGGWKSVAVPNKQEAAEFSAENFDGSAKHSPLGSHQAYLFPWFPQDPEFQKECPGVHLLARANMIGSKFKDHKRAVEVGDKLVQQAENMTKRTDKIEEDDDGTLLQTGSNSLFAVTLRVQA